MRVLVVEDDLDLLNLLEEGLSTYGYAVDKAVNGEEAIEMAYIENYDIIILDINLPKKDGFEVLDEVRKFNQEVNIIMLTARSDIDDRVKGLDFGANDYMVKPFDLKELDARMRALLRRKSITESTILEAGNMKFDTMTREAFVSDQKLNLTQKETGILEYLFLNKERFVSSEELIDHVWDSNADSFSNSVRVHMSSLRKKIKELSGENKIQNVIGKGYRIYES
ncbi:MULTISPECIES: response regulator transcription factor [Anaerococcus]|uniref:DNA-binding response regulator n=1 Tax=Anaerococcus octavius TaxID=54007 RepID=A0A2I1M557_9FIRM|nr:MULTISPECIES: response regulator transcription factor [Anaerococcus]MBS6106791.1 response regulator transcription factor [Anaerococcus sp.]MDU0893972.1 response regulator transcription factor [Anaerococcus sp.]MDU2599341.1 response regulator transcription factor [Anaerococcus sp.]MDU3177466.1 response regulator transcription factor [Anaerococcus sp.]MDU4026472.1 response regulator transcription factor [Anaerococcus sp.]